MGLLYYHIIFSSLYLHGYYAIIYFMLCDAIELSLGWLLYNIMIGVYVLIIQEQHKHYLMKNKRLC